MKLSTTYLGFKLRSPLVPSSSPLCEDIDNLRLMEDAGAGAVILPSVFEEQIPDELEADDEIINETRRSIRTHGLLPTPDDFNFATNRYLLHIVKAKQALGIPVIASLNGRTFGGWMAFARAIEQAGADAIELNLYSIPTDSSLPAEEIETDYRTILAAVKGQVKIPVAVKLSPHFTNFAHFARRLDEQGADGLVLFNRFYQPDIDLETMQVAPTIRLSTSGDLRLPLRWIGILHGRIRASLAATSGIHRGTDALKMLMVGADVTMLCSALMRHGIGHLAVIEREMREWMEHHGFDSVQQIKGMLSQKSCPDPGAFERAQYIRAIAIERVIEAPA